MWNNRRNDSQYFFIIAFLCLEPTLFQYHSSFWTESIFFSLQLVLLGLIINEKKSYKNFFVIGILLGITFLQKTVAIFLIFFVVIYLIFDEKEKKILNNLILFAGFIIVLSFLTLDNYKKTGILYIMPTQTKTAHYHYIAKRIVKENEGSIIKLKKEEEKWKIENYYNEDNFKSNYEYSNFLQDQAIQIMLDNKIKTIKIYFKNSLSHLVLNPLQTFYWHKYNDKLYKNKEFHLSEEAQNYFYFKLLYSLIVYSIIALGLIKIFTNKFKINFHLLILILVLYFVFILGWVGNSRYFMPSLIFLSVFFGNGLVQLKKIFFQNKL